MNFSCIDRLNAQFLFDINSPVGFDYFQAQERCSAVGASVTRITSNTEYDLILDFAFNSALQQGINVSEVNDLPVWVGLEVIESDSGREPVLRFDDGNEDVGFFQNFGSFPWKTNQPDFFLPVGESHFAVFDVNINRPPEEALFFIDQPGITYGVICRKDAGCVEEDEGFLDEILFYEIVGGIAGMVLLLMVVLLWKKRVLRGLDHDFESVLDSLRLSSSRV